MHCLAIARSTAVFRFLAPSLALLLSIACSSSGGSGRTKSDTSTTGGGTASDASFVDGADGNDGATTATDAADGADGATTATDGVDGSTGTDGVTAVDGSAGVDGMDGTTSTDGADGGTTAVDGVDGSTGTDGVDGATGSGAVGDHCQSADDCQGNVCITLSEGYCSQKGCSQGMCPAGAECFTFDNQDTYCLKLCSSNSDCESDQICDTDGTCWPGETTPPPTGDGSVGSPCTQDSDCTDQGAVCYPENFNGEHTGFLNGYCIIFSCPAAGCPTGSVCQEVTSDGGTACVAACQATTDCRFDEGYACYQGGICFPGCGATSGATCPTNYACDAEAQQCVPACTEGSCPAGTVCKDDGTCGDPPCTPGSCGTGLVCADSGVCVPDLEGGPGVGPGPACNNLPAMDCTGTVAQCGAVTQFTPVNGTGYTNYPLNGENWDNQYRSFCREDLQMLIKWATAYVDCKATGWGGGNGYPLGLGDMSEADGAIPGTSVGSPGHPPGTHVDGYDMDIAYYSNSGSNNYLKAVCDHVVAGADQYHCTSEPYLMDLWRTALFIGALFSSERTRVIGVDGKIGPLVGQALDVLCANGWLPQYGCDNYAANPWMLAYEVENGGAGWYNFHHHHLHVSLWGVQAKPGAFGGPKGCLTPDCSPIAPGAHPCGHAHSGIHFIDLPVPVDVQL